MHKPIAMAAALAVIGILVWSVLLTLDYSSRMVSLDSDERAFSPLEEKIDIPSGAELTLGAAIETANQRIESTTSLAAAIIAGVAIVWIQERFLSRRRWRRTVQKGLMAFAATCAVISIHLSFLQLQYLETRLANSVSPVASSLWGDLMTSQYYFVLAGVVSLFLAVVILDESTRVTRA